MISYETQKKELISFCEEQYIPIYENDMLGIEKFNNYDKGIKDTDVVNILLEYKFLSLNLPEICKSQIRYSNLIKEVQLAKNYLLSKIEKTKDPHKSNNQRYVSVIDSSSIDVYTNKMASYATLIGRASACGIDPEVELLKVGKWMDNWFELFKLDNKMRSMYQIIFINGAKLHANQQISGESPDNCEQVIRAYKNVHWP